MAAASTDSLLELHRKLAKQLEATLDRDIEDNMPTDAATLSVISNFLKNNSITCDPAERDVTGGLQEKFREQARVREERKQKALSLVKEAATGT